MVTEAIDKVMAKLASYLTTEGPRALAELISHRPRSAGSSAEMLKSIDQGSMLGHNIHTPSRHHYFIRADHDIRKQSSIWISVFHV